MTTKAGEIRAAFELQLIQGLRAKKEELIKQQERCNDHWVYEDLVYRFYHHSFKVFYLQDVTTTIVTLLRSLLPDRELNAWFTQIVAEGTGKVFKNEDNQNWLAVTRPMLEAFFHARYFLEMACRYVDIEEGVTTLPSGWAGFLYLYNLR